MRESEMPEMILAYVECALWSSTDEAGEPLDDEMEYLISEETQAEMAADCEAFYAANAADLADIDAVEAGHDFWLTRNRHGAGFWDRGLGDVGKRLSDAANVYGEAYLELGDDMIVRSL
jgi:hypothetical protein